jgi:hypothetical protein
MYDRYYQPFNQKLVADFEAFICSVSASISTGLVADA